MSTIAFRVNNDLQALYDVEPFSGGSVPLAPLFASVMIAGDERCNTAVAIISEGWHRPEIGRCGLLTIVENQDAGGETADGDEPHEWEKWMPCGWNRERIETWAAKHLNAAAASKTVVIGTDELEALGFERVN